MTILIHVLVALGVLWQPVRPGVWQTEFPVAQHGALSSVRVVALRIDPSRFSFSLDTATRDFGLRGAWSVDDVPDDAVVAFNAGHFRGGWPWGWLVLNGVESQPPGTGRLAMSFVIDSAGTAHLAAPNEIPLLRPRAILAFQSYPAVVIDGKIPIELQREGLGVDLTHRDSRLAICIHDDGSIIVAITRFGALGRLTETVPYGPTTPEMAGVMLSLGCRRALLLDGGVSSQLAVRNAQGELTRWSNWRMVPLGVVVTPRR